MSVEEKERKNELTACGCADANECKKREERKKKLTRNGGMQTRMCCMWMALRADANECKKKEKKKKTYLEWGHTDANALRADGVACGWCCMRMVLRADALYGDVDGGSCRDGGHG